MTDLFSSNDYTVRGTGRHHLDLGLSPCLFLFMFWAFGKRFSLHCLCFFPCSASRHWRASTSLFFPVPSALLAFALAPVAEREARLCLHRLDRLSLAGDDRAMGVGVSGKVGEWALGLGLGCRLSLGIP